MDVEGIIDTVGNVQCPHNKEVYTSDKTSNRSNFRFLNKTWQNSKRHYLQHQLIFYFHLLPYSDAFHFMEQGHRTHGILVSRNVITLQCPSKKQQPESSPKKCKLQKEVKRLQIKGKRHTFSINQSIKY